MPAPLERDSIRSTNRAKSAVGDAHRALCEEIAACTKCARLVDWREEVATNKRAAFADETYWGRAVPGFGDLSARLCLVGLAPAAHGANRTGRMFTGDRSGDFLYAGLSRTGYANQATSLNIEDGLRLQDAYITAAVRCAPPDNRPTPTERDACASYLRREFDLLANVKVVLALGAFSYEAIMRELVVETVPRTPRPRFGHGVELNVGLAASPGVVREVTLLCSYHPSQRNVFTGLLTADAFDTVLQRARVLCGEAP